MGAKKATTTADLTGSPEDVEKLTASGEDPQPTREDLVERIEESTDPEMVADNDEPKTVKVKGPFGVTEVPESIVDALLASGYTKSK